MELIERYIYAVSRHLPENQRADVADELRGLIEDTLEEKGSRSKKTVHEVLVELGDPELFVLQYRDTKQYLIGPKLFGMYLKALKLTAAIGLPIGLAISLISQIIEQPDNIPGFFVALVGSVVAIGIQIVFWVTLVFFVLERSNVDGKELAKENPWTPEMLPEVTTKRQIPLSDVIGDMIWYAIIIALPLLSQSVLVAYTDNQSVPFFNPQIAPLWIGIIVAIGIVGFVKSALKLRVRNWTLGLASFNIAFALIFSAALIALPITTQLINPAFITLLDTHINTANLAEITKAVNWTVGISIAATVGMYLYEAFNSMRLALSTKKA